MAYQANDYPHVTGILDILGKPGLYKWYSDYGYDICRKMLEAAGRRGTATHKAVELFLKTGKFDGLSETDETLSTPYHEGIEKYVKEKGIKVYKTECKVINDKDGYQGTLDCLGRINNDLILFDWKTSRKLRPEHQLQVAAYWAAYQMEHPDELIKEARVVRFAKKGVFQEVIYKELDAAYNVFRGLILVYNFFNPKEDSDE